jgi:6-phosphogluconolactonase (cycloisomerase 2 family)
VRIWTRALPVAGAVAVVLLTQGAFATSYNDISSGGPEPVTAAQLNATPVLAPVVNGPSTCTASGFTFNQANTANLSYADSQSASLDAAGNNLVSGYNIVRATSYSGTYASEGTVGPDLTGTTPTTFTESPTPVASPSAFVLNDGTMMNAQVTPYTEPSTEGTKVTLSQEPGVEPNSAAISPDGATMVVTEGTTNTVDVLTISGGTATLAKSFAPPPPPGNTAPPTFKNLTAVAIDPVPISGDYVAFVVADEGSGTAGDVFEITLNGTSSTLNTTPVVIGEQGATTNPTSIVVTPDGTKVYVANYASHNVSEFSTATLPATATAITLDSHTNNSPIALAVTPDSAHVYEADKTNSAIDDITTSTNTVGATAIALTNGGLTDANITSGGDPNILAMMPNGDSLYVAEYGASKIQQVYTAIGSTPDTVDTTTTLAGSGGVSDTPDALALSPNGCELYASTYSATKGAIFPINAQTPGATTTTNISVTQVNDPNSLVVTADNQFVLDAATGSGGNSDTLITTKTDSAASRTAGTAPISVVAIPSAGYWYEVQASHLSWTSVASSPQPFSIGFNPGGWQ